jgi:predicted hydrolase (HD superfamily)
MNKEEAIQFVKKHTKNKNLMKHMLAVGACMKGLAQHFGESEDNQKKWEVAGIVHDADYELLKDDGDKHPSLVFDWLEEEGVEQSIIDAVKAHAWGYSPICKEPESNMEWSIYCCDELTGFIIAVTLIRPTKKLADVEVEHILKKWPKKDFAKGVIRESIELCKDKLRIELEDFIKICLKSMKAISLELGL